MSKKYKWLLFVGILLIVLVAFNFLSFQIMGSNTTSEFSLATGRAGDALPPNMTAPFTIMYQVTGAARLVEPLQEALPVELAALPTVLEARPAADDGQGNPLLVVEVTIDPYLWTPFFARGTATAVIYFASAGEITWQRNETLLFETSPAIKADGEFTLTDRSWGLISKPAYAQHLSAALGQSIAEGLQKDVFTFPAGR